MTISTEIRKAGPYAGNDVTASFPFAFKVFYGSDLLVVVADGNDVETVLGINTDYSVTLNADQNENPGGAITLPAPLPAGSRIVVVSAVPNVQPTDITNNGGFYPRVIEDALDRTVAQVQQLAEMAERTLRVQISSPVSGETYLTQLIVDTAAARSSSEAAEANATAALGVANSIAGTASDALAAAQAAVSSISSAVDAANAAAAAANAVTDKANSALSIAQSAQATADNKVTAAQAAAVAPVQSVSGKTGAVSLAASDVGLGSVTNAAQLKVASNLSDLGNVSSARGNLGLGTAATSNVTTNESDVTPGRVLRVGGLGAPNDANYRHFSTGASSDSQDFNTITGRGLFASVVRGDAPNGPGGARYFYVVVLQFSAGTVTQIAYPYSTTLLNRDVYVRTCYAGTWHSWSRMLTDAATGLTHAAKVGGIQSGSVTNNVGPSWGKLFWNSIAFDHFPSYTETVKTVGNSAGVPNGNFVLQRDGVYRFKAQIYVGPPENASAKISMYLGLTDRGTDGTDSALLHVANQEFPGGQHPSLSIDCLIQHIGTRFYSFDWYYLDGASLTPTMTLQASALYCWATVEGVR